MRVWKLQASKDEERIINRWGYAFTETAEEALELARNTSGLPLNWVHEKHPAMLWPGQPGKKVSWSN